MRVNKNKQINSSELENKSDLVSKEKNTKWIGTHENCIVWFNSTSKSGLVLASLTTAFLLFSILISICLSNVVVDIKILFLCVMSLWCHIATMLSDPGAVPKDAHPIISVYSTTSTTTTTTTISSFDTNNTCCLCESFKPPGCHHDFVSERCISRMDFFCPWINKYIILYIYIYIYSLNIYYI